VSPEPYVQRVLDHFSHVERDGKGWKVPCPCHEDTHPSLGLAIGREGKILVNCRVCGAKMPAVAEAIGLQQSDFFPPRDGAPTVPVGKRELVATYEYVAEDGTPLYEVRRYSNKSFPQHRPDGTPGIEGIRRVVYHLELIQGKKTVYLVEGEKDADNLIALDIWATCNSGGAGKWTEAHTQQLVAANVKQGVVLPDQDQAGALHGQTVARSCHAAGLVVKVVNLPELPEKGDVSDYLAAGHSRKDLAALVKEAPVYAPTVEDESFGLKVVPMESVRSRPINWLWPGRLPRGELTLIVGDPATGKTFVTEDITARITTGKAWPNGELMERGAVVYLTVEDNLETSFKPRLEAMGADGSGLYAVTGKQGSSGLVSLTADLDRIRQLCAYRRAKLLVISPVNAYLGTDGGKGVDNYRDPEVRSVLTPIVQLAQALDLAAVGIMHLNKTQQAQILYRIGGTIAFAAVPRAVFSVVRDTSDRDRRYLTTLKMSDASEPKTIPFRLVSKPGEAARVEWEPETEDTASDLMASDQPAKAGGGRRGAGTKVAEAGEWLADFLKECPQEHKAVLAAGSEMGYTLSTLKRALARIKGSTRDVRDEKGGWITGSFWSAPPTAPPMAP